MTDNQLRIVADGFFDGGLAADVAPKDLRAAVTLLCAAGQPGSPAELVTLDTRVREFSTEINVAAQASTPPMNAEPSNGKPSIVDIRFASDSSLLTDTLRSTPMFATRITRKALTIVAITLLAAGTAAAAAGGALPMFEEESAAVVENNNGSNVIHDVPQKSDTGQPPTDVSEHVPPAPAAVVAAVESVVETVDYVDVSEETAAEPEDEGTVDNEPKDETPAAKDPADNKPADKPEDESDDEESPDDKPKDDSAAPADDDHSGGGEGHGRGRGDGRGKDDRGHGNDNHDHDDHGNDDHGNGNHGNGNHGKGKDKGKG